MITNKNEGKGMTEHSLVIVNANSIVQLFCVYFHSAPVQRVRTQI